MTVERATKNFGWVFGLYLGRRALRLGYIAVFARVLQEQGFGNYYFLLQIVPILLAAGLFGLGVYVAREVSARKEDAALLIGRSMGLGLAGTVTLAAVFAAVAPWMPYGADVRLGMAIIALGIIPRGIIILLTSASTAYERLGLYAVLENAAPLVEAAVGTVLLLTGHGLVSLCVLNAAVYTAYAIVFFVLVEKRIARFRILFEPRTWGGILRGSRMMWGFAALVVLATHFGTVILSAVAGNAQVGFFGVAMTLVDVIQAAAVAFGAAVFPYMVRAWQRSADELKDFLGTCLRLLATGAVALGFLAAILAAPALTLVFGPRFAAAAPVLRILAWIVFPMLFEQIATQACFAAGRPGLPIAGHLVLNAARIGLGVWLVKAMGDRAAEGLAWALLASSAIGFVTYSLLLSRALGKFGAWTHLARLAAAAAIPAALAWWGWGRLNPWLLAPASAALFVAGAWLVGCVDRREFEVVRRSVLAFRTRTPAEAADPAPAREESEV